MKPAAASERGATPASEKLFNKTDAIILALLLTIGFFWLRTTPEFAANLPQDSADFCIPAVTFLQRGYLGTIIHEQLQPTGRTIGVPLLLIPGYIIFGQFIGNGIYTILLLALGTAALVYFIGREMCGRLGGAIAAIFLIGHHGFRVYSQKIMSEVPALFFVTLVLALVLIAIKQPRRIWPYPVLGLAVGLGLIIRSENLLLALPIGVLWLMKLFQLNVRKVVLVAVCIAPWLLAQAVYNKTHYGSFRRTAYDWIGWFQTPSFALRNATAIGYWTETNHYSKEFADKMDGNFLSVIKSLLSETDHSLPFSNPGIWAGRPRAFYQTLLLLRTMLGLGGLVWCFRWWRQRPEVRAFTVWFLIVMLTTIVFYTLFAWQEERYLMRVLTMLCVLNAIGVVATLDAIRARWPRLEPQASFWGAALVGGVVALLAFVSRSGLAYAGDDNLYLYGAMTSAASKMEDNAIIVSDWDPWRIDILMIRGTDRKFIPTCQMRNTIRYPASHPDGVYLAPFSVAEEPEKLLAMQQQGRPAYLLLRDPFDYHPPPPEVEVFKQYWELQPLASFTGPQGQVIGYYLYRLRPLQSAPQS